MKATNIHGVVSADVKGSSGIAVNDWGQILDQLKIGLKVVEKSGWGRSWIKRGDTIQVLVYDPSRALEVAFLIKTILNGYRNEDALVSSKPEVDAWLSIGIGEVTLERTELSESTGPAFLRAGRGLEILKRKRKVSLIIQTGDKSIDAELKVSTHLMSAIMSRWSYAASEVLNCFLHGSTTQVQIAEKLDISQSSVQRRMEAMEWDALVVFLKRFQKLITNMSK